MAEMQPSYAAVDWGTSSFRLWLVDRDGRVVAERRSDEGMVAAGKIGFAAVLESHLGALGAPADLPVAVCGMAGARQGWKEAGYVYTPAPLGAILQGAIRIPDLGRDVSILPGVAQRNRGAPDVIRGEETQLLGALGEAPKDDALVCMPGTHSKWVSVSGGRIERFRTFMTGELFDAIRRHTILSHAVAGADAARDAASFRSAVQDVHERPALATNRLFQARAGSLLFNDPPTTARECISGTLIGLELAGGLSDRTSSSEVILIASGPLADLYGSALAALSVPHKMIDADGAALSGLSLAARRFWAR
jgi:2-dehydro-3-deoxygalactonokinase